MGNHRADPLFSRRRLVAGLVAVVLTLSSVTAVTPKPDPVALADPAPPVPASPVQTIVPTPAAVPTTADQPAPSTPVPPLAQKPVETALPPLPDKPVSRPASPVSRYGGVRPRVAVIGNEVQSLFAVSTVYGVASRSTPSDHPRGLALDFMVGRVTGDLLAQHMLANFSEYRLSYVIWRQRINTGRGWAPMPDRGSRTANHYDHVHVSFLP